MARRRRSTSSIPRQLSVLALFAAVGGLGYYLHSTYGTLEPCGMLRGEVQVRLMDGRVDSLGDVPKLIVNNGDQVWCSKEFMLTQFR